MTTYSVDWNADRIIWTINGKAVRTVTAASTNGSFPNTPSRIQMAVWDGGAMAPGTAKWAGGSIDWSKQPPNGFSASYQSVSIQW